MRSSMSCTESANHSLQQRPRQRCLRLSQSTGRVGVRQVLVLGGHEVHLGAGLPLFEVLRDLLLALLQLIQAHDALCDEQLGERVDEHAICEQLLLVGEAQHVGELETSGQTLLDRQHLGAGGWSAAVRVDLRLLQRVHLHQVLLVHRTLFR